jgi:hypothetical protein
MLASFKAFFMPRKTGVESQHSTAPVNYADHRFDERPSAATRLALPSPDGASAKMGITWIYLRNLRSRLEE